MLSPLGEISLSVDALLVSVRIYASLVICRGAAHNRRAVTLPPNRCKACKTVVTNTSNHGFRLRNPMLLTTTMTERGVALFHKHPGRVADPVGARLKTQLWRNAQLCSHLEVD